MTSLSLKQRALLRRLRELTDQGIREPHLFREWLRPQDIAGIALPVDIGRSLRPMAIRGYIETRNRGPGVRKNLFLYRISENGRRYLESLDGPGTHTRPPEYVPELIQYIEKGGVRQFGMEPAEKLS